MIRMGTVVSIIGIMFWFRQIWHLKQDVTAAVVNVQHLGEDLENIKAGTIRLVYGKSSDVSKEVKSVAHSAKNSVVHSYGAIKHSTNALGRLPSIWNGCKQLTNWIFSTVYSYFFDAKSNKYR